MVFYKNSLDPICTSELCVLENMFIRGTALSKTTELKKKKKVAISNDSLTFSILLLVDFVSYFSHQCSGRRLVMAGRARQ